MPKKEYNRQSGKNHLPKGMLQYKIRKLFKENPGSALSAEDVIRMLNISNSQAHIESVMEKFVTHGFLVTGKPGKYLTRKQERTQKKKKYFTGTVDMTRTGSAYIIAEDFERDVHIAQKYINTALDGDTVVFELFYGKKSSRYEGKIIEVTKRANDQFMGTLKKYGKYAVVTVDRVKREFEIFIDFSDLADARQDDKVIAEITEWRGRKEQVPWGRVVRSFGPNEDHDMEMNAILVNNGFKIDFPEEVLQETAQLKEGITAEDLAMRRDFREVITFTIDPFNARDFDDALSIRLNEKGNYEIGIHIADVTHFVRPNSALDKEAYDRSTSVYLVDRVCPMLPEKLSNELCSLRPEEDKFTFSAVFEFDQQFNLKSEWFGKSLIHSNRRFTYEEVQEILETGRGDFSEELQLIDRIAKKLRKEKFENGAISFESDEVTFILDEDGTPLEIVEKERKDAHMLVEDFMLLANRKVATFITNKYKQKKLPFVYRIHDDPDPEKLQDFALFAKEFGFEMNLSTPKHVASSFNALSEAAALDERLKILEPLALRTMSKAVYSTENIGHYGLSFENYTHFTSPIRRYADVMVHRILYQNLTDEYRMDKAKLEAICNHISAQERKAVDAERESIKFKQVEYIIEHIGEVFEGVISGIIERGFFVMLNNSRIEGLVGFDSLDEFYTVDSSRLRITGRDSGHVMRMGDAVSVRVIDADLDKRQVEMELNQFSKP
jgi:ribonuclease R